MVQAVTIEAKPQAKTHVRISAVLGRTMHDFRNYALRRVRGRHLQLQEHRGFAILPPVDDCRQPQPIIAPKNTIVITENGVHDQSDYAQELPLLALELRGWRLAGRSIHPDIGVLAPPPS